MARQSLLSALLLLNILAGVLNSPLANAQCPKAGKLQVQLDEIEKKANLEQISLLTDLAKEFQRCQCVDSSYALVLYDLGRAFYMEGQDESALKEFQASVAINRQLKLGPNPAGQINKTLSSALFYLSYLYKVKGDYLGALSLAEQSIYYARRCASKLLEARSLGEKARDLMMIGKTQEAFTIINKAIQLIQYDSTAADNRILFIMLKAQIARHIGNPVLSVSLYQQAIDYYLRKQHSGKVAYAYGNLGYLYMDTFKDYKKAIAYFQLAYKAFTNPYEKARVLNNMGDNYVYQGQWSRALTTYQQAFQTLPINFQQTDVRQNPSGDAMQLSVDKECLLTLFQGKANTWLAYAKASQNRQRLQYAIATYQVADQMIDLMRWEHTGQQSKLFWRQKTRGMYERAIETCYRLNDAEQAFRFMEKSRAVMLSDKLNELGAQQQLAPKQAAEEQRLRQRVSDQQNELARLTPDSGRYTPARVSLSAIQDSLDGFLKQLEASNPAYYRYKYDNSTPSLTNLKRYLEQQQSSLVTYFVGDSALYMMAVTGKGAILHKQPIDVYNQTLRQFSSLLANTEAMRQKTDVSRFLTLSNSLFQQLLAPLALPKGRVVVSPDGSFIPFDALSRSASQPQYVVNDYAFSYVYSASLLLKNQGKERRRAGFRVRDFLGVAPVDFAPALKQVILPNSDAALKPIAGRFSSPMLLTHEDATRRAFLTQANKARIIHLFTHAVADSTEQEPMLYFADSTLKLSDLNDGSLPNAELVVLAACKTGIGANQRGEGVFSLARGFAALGVPSVLTTLWSVQTEATYQLTDLFYTYLDQGMPKDIALQRAKQDWLKTADGASQLPNYWAGLIVVGDAEPLAPIHYGLWTLGLVVLTASGLMGGRWAWRRRQHQTPPTVSSPSLP